jgi:hypothetical protein
MTTPIQGEGVGEEKSGIEKTPGGFLLSARDKFETDGF